MFTPFHIYQVAGRKMLLIKSSINLRLQTMKAKWFQISAPMLTVDSNFVPFTQDYGSFSAMQNFTISGKSLEGPVKVTAPEGFLIRINYKPPYYTRYFNWIKSGYVNPSSRIIDTVTIDVVSKAFLTGIVRGQIVLTSQNMTPLKIWVETEVNTPELDTLVASYVEMTGFTSGLRFISRYAEVSQYGIAYREIGDAEFTYVQIGTTLGSDSFIGSINELLPEVAYEYFGYVVINSEVYTGQFRIITTADFMYSTTEQDIGTDTFTIAASSIVGYDLVESYGIEYKKASEETWTRQEEGTVLANDNFEVVVGNLEIGIEYNWRIYFQINSIYYYSTVDSISLLTPSLTTTTGGTITQIGFSTGASSIVGYEQVEAHGIQYKKSSDSSWTSVQKGSTLTSNFFTQTLTNLLPNTEYNYRAYITIGTHVYFGETKTLTTLAVSLTTRQADNVGPTSFRSGATGILGWQYASAYGVEYRTGADDFLSSGVVGSLGANSFYRLITGLMPETLYDYRAYIIINGNTYYGITRQVITTRTP